MIQITPLPEYPRLERSQNLAVYIRIRPDQVQVFKTISYSAQGVTMNIDTTVTGDVIGIELLGVEIPKP